MNWLRSPDIRQRLWIAFALLATSTIFVGGIAWYSLDRASERLELLHNKTVTQVARALSLSKQSSDIATTAPFLLNLKSSELIEREGRLLVEVLEPVLSAWPDSQLNSKSVIYAFEAEIAAVAQQMELSIADLIQAAALLNAEREITQSIGVRLSRLELQFYRQSSNLTIDHNERRNWLLLQSMTNELFASVHAKNLLGVGEHRRNFQAKSRVYKDSNTTAVQDVLFQNLVEMSEGDIGLFDVRRRELSRNLEGQNALFRIRHQASKISELAVQFAENAESYLGLERQKTSTSMDFAKVAILLVGLGALSIALLASIFVSRYVTSNIKAISDAMLRLAQGDRSTQLNSIPEANDEIGKLHHSFRVFRGNALRLDRINKQLNQKNVLFEETFDNISEGVAITSDTGHITAGNGNFATVLRLDPDLLFGRPAIADLLAKTGFADQVKEAGIDINYHGLCELENAAGQSLEVRCSRLPDGGGVWLFADATERREMDKRLRQIQQIECLGKVTGEVAHDFGNVLSAITANIYLLQTGSRKVSRKVLLQRVANAAELGISLTQRLLTFARQQRLDPEVVELNELVVGLSDLVEIGLKPEVTLEVVTCDEKLFVSVDPGQLESAIFNLCLNANQAIEAAGRIRISVAKTSDTTANIDVVDTGCGMAGADVVRSPEPFFTARKDGQGTGLGLSMVHGFIKQTGGDIQIFSTLGRGTTVALSLPLCQQCDEPAPAPNLGRAMLVEDDPNERFLTSRLLSHMGYQVSEAGTFDEALMAFDEGQGFDVLVTDLHLDQGHSGWDVTRKCLAQYPSAKIIVTSGRMPGTHPYSDGHEVRVTCLEKPLTIENVRASFAEPVAMSAAVS